MLARRQGHPWAYRSSSWSPTSPYNILSNLWGSCDVLLPASQRNLDGARMHQKAGKDDRD